MIITLSSLGYGAGKDTAARHLVRLGFTHLKCTTPLVESLRLLDPLIAADGMRWAACMKYYGYDAAKTHPEYGAEFRRLLQVMGTEVGRGVLSDGDLWSDILERKIAETAKADLARGERIKVVVSDVRFPNEIEACAGWVPVKSVLLTGRGISDPHASENALRGFQFDRYIRNTGTISELEDAIEEVAIDES